jgi:hypothetical protein
VRGDCDLGLLDRQFNEGEGVLLSIFEEDNAFAEHAEGVPLAVYLSCPEKLILAAEVSQDTFEGLDSCSVAITAEEDERTVDGRADLSHQFAVAEFCCQYLGGKHAQSMIVNQYLFQA